MAQCSYKRSMAQPLGLYCSLPSAGEKNLQAMSAFEKPRALPDPHCSTDDPTMLWEEKFEILEPYTPTHIHTLALYFCHTLSRGTRPTLFRHMLRPGLTLTMQLGPNITAEPQEHGLTLATPPTWLEPNSMA